MSVLVPDLFSVVPCAAGPGLNRLDGFRPGREGARRQLMAHGGHPADTPRPPAASRRSTGSTGARISPFF